MDITSLIERITTERIAGMHRLADWWFAKFTGRPRHDNGAPGHLPSLMAGSIASTIAEKHSVDGSTANRDKFRAALVARAQPVDEKWWHDSHIGTDYHPDKSLAEAMADCGIDQSRAPWKTNTHVYGSGLVISVADGYAARHVTIYMAPVLDLLATLSDDDIAAIEKSDQRIRISYAVDTAVRAFIGMAQEKRHRDPAAMAYVIDAIARARAEVETNERHDATVDAAVARA